MAASPEITSRVLGVAADVFEEPRESLDESSSPETILRWDSVKHHDLTLEIEEDFGIQLPPEDLDQLVTLGAVADAVQRSL